MKNENQYKEIKKEYEPNYLNIAMYIRPCHYYKIILEDLTPNSTDKIFYTGILKGKGNFKKRSMQYLNKCLDMIKVDSLKFGELKIGNECWKISCTENLEEGIIVAYDDLSAIIMVFTTQEFNHYLVYELFQAGIYNDYRKDLEKCLVNI